MKNLLKISALALFVAVSAFAFTSLSPSAATAQEGEETPASEQVQEEQTGEEQQPEESQDQEQNQSTRYAYIAQPGDSFTKIARKAVQTYGFFENTNLSLAEIVAAETFLTSDAGFPALYVGQAVNLSEEAVKSAVEKAQGLDDAAEARWEHYVPHVDFNTDNVGESR